MTGQPPVLVLDDDPTGAQAQSGVPVALEWGPEVLGELATRDPDAIHFLTNTRALAPVEARSVTFQAASAAMSVFADSPIVLRGDSTLRAHLLPEYLGLRDAAFGSRTPVLMLVPALPAAGRVTRGGTHYLERDGHLVPIADTEYARDGEFSYRSARLLEWAEERSQGFFPAACGRELSLEDLRGAGPEKLGSALHELGALKSPAVLAVDAATDEDLAIAAAGLRAAVDAGAEVIVRTAPAFVAVLAGTAALGYEPLPADCGTILVLCGSHVPTSTRQLARLCELHPESVVWVSTQQLISADAESEVAAAAAAASDLLATTGLAVVATSREVLASADRVRDGGTIASGLAGILARVRGNADIVISKGGITSAVNIREGLKSGVAEVLGPVQDGVSLWSVDTPERRELPFVVFPGNVGSDDALADLVSAIGAAR